MSCRGDCADTPKTRSVGEPRVRTQIFRPQHTRQLRKRWYKSRSIATGTPEEQLDKEQRLTSRREQRNFRTRTGKASSLVDVAYCTTNIPKCMDPRKDRPIDANALFSDTGESQRPRVFFTQATYYHSSISRSVLQTSEKRTG